MPPVLLPRRDPNEGETCGARRIPRRGYVLY